MKNRLLYDTKKITMNQHRTDCLFSPIYPSNEVQRSEIIRKIHLILWPLGPLMSEYEIKLIFSFFFHFAKVAAAMALLLQSSAGDHNVLVC